MKTITTKLHRYRTMTTNFINFDCELAWTSFDTAVRKVSFLWNGMMQGDNGNPTRMNPIKSNNQKRIHPTEKPIYIYKWIMDKYLQNDYNILDTHGGSMSIGIAAHDYGFNIDICEIDKTYFSDAMQRLKSHVSQQKMF